MHMSRNDVQYMGVLTNIFLKNNIAVASLYCIWIICRNILVQMGIKMGVSETVVTLQEAFDLDTLIYNIPTRM